MFRKILALCVCGFSLQGFALDEAPTQLPPPNAPKPISEKNVTPSARTCPELSGVFVTGEFIYWKARQDELINTTKLNIDIIPTGAGIDIRPIEMDFKFDPGFKLGIGGDLPFDGWDLYLNWTHFHTHPTRTTSSSRREILAFFGRGLGGVGGPPAVGNFAKSSWNLMFNSLDFDWGRRFYLSQSLSIRPSFGTKAVWIHQKLRVDIKDIELLFINQPGEPQFHRLRNNFWGIGPYAAFEGKWTFGWGIGLFGEVSSALLWGKFEQKESFGENRFDGGNVFQVLRKFSAEAHRVRPTAQAFIGLDWEWCFIKKWLSLNLRVGYETQYFWSQLLNGTQGKEESDLTFDGLTFMGRLDF